MQCHTNPEPHTVLDRGVYVMPYLGPNGELIIASIARNGQRVHERLMGSDERVEDVTNELAMRLDEADPPLILKIA